MRRLIPSGVARICHVTGRCPKIDEKIKLNLSKILSSISTFARCPGRRRACPPLVTPLLIPLESASRESRNLIGPLSANQISRFVGCGLQGCESPHLTGNHRKPIGNFCLDPRSVTWECNVMVTVRSPPISKSIISFLSRVSVLPRRYLLVC